MSNSIKVTKAKQREATKNKLIEIASEEFSTKGYSGASTEVIVQKAGLTRGALYHHFKNKIGLFSAVFVAAQEEIGRRVEAQADTSNDLWDQLVFGCRAFLKASSDPLLQQIVVIDGPAVLKWETVRQIDLSLEEGALMLLKGCLNELIDSGIIKALPIDALAHLLSGAMDEASIWIAQSNNPKKALLQAQTTLELLLSSLKINA